MAIKIFLAVGHGKSTDGRWDTGCVLGNVRECDLAFNIVGVATKILRQYGVDVRTDYDTGNDRNCTYTIRDANAWGADYYMSVHCDYDKAPSGTYPIIYPGSSSGMAFAQSVNKAYMARTGLGTRGILQRDDMEVANTNMTACIFEAGSIKADLNILQNADLCGKALADGILNHFGIAHTIDGQVITPVASTPTQTVSTTVSSTTFNGDVYDTENIQYFLNLCNYGCPDIDGDYGPDTTRCVKIAQTAYKIAVDGEWGPDTETHAAEQVKGYQIQLTNKGFPCDADGIAGPATFQAAKNFQAANGLEADGIIGSASYPVLFKSVTVSAPANNTASVTSNSKSMIGLNWQGIDPNNLPNFEQSEFTCEDGCGGTVVDDLKVIAQMIRNKFGETTISSGARCPSQNARVGGVADSLHVPQNNASGKAEAMDLYCSPMSDAKVDEIASYARSLNSNIGTIRYYNRGSARLFVHVQIYPRDTIGN